MTPPFVSPRIPKVQQYTYTMTERQLSYLFGGDRPWTTSAWTASDDRVRGGRSQSYLRCHSDKPAVFYGHLDIKALGGAGFASQRTFETLDLDLSSYEGLCISIDQSDGKKYTLTLKDEILPQRPDGREQSTVSWEYDFGPATAGELFVKWSDFKPTYRGKPKPNTAPLNLARIQRISFMMRSFFGEQQGEFKLAIKHVAAFGPRPSCASSSSSSSSDISGVGKLNDTEATPSGYRKTPWKQWLCGWV